MNDENNNFGITNNWSRQSDQIRVKFPQLTAKDLKYERGKEENLLQKMEERLQRTRYEVIQIIRNEAISY